MTPAKKKKVTVEQFKNILHQAIDEGWSIKQLLRVLEIYFNRKCDCSGNQCCDICTNWDKNVKDKSPASLRREMSA